MPDLAALVTANLTTPYPFHLTHMVRGDTDVQRPAELYPAFHTSYDWHSCVHMHWLGVELVRAGSATPELRARLDANLTTANLTAEAAYLRRNRTFERPYGWAWAARLAASCRDTPWDTACGVLADAVYANATAWARTIHHPVRHGVHANTAFGLALLISAADELGRPADAIALRTDAVRLFGGDAGWVPQWELSGQDFLSPGLAEADLMARVLPAEQFRTWFAAFLPEWGPAAEPAVVTDPTDPQMVHLDGLNISRAGALYRLATVLDDEAMRTAGDALLVAGMAAMENEDYGATHWLASFAWDASVSR